MLKLRSFVPTVAVLSLAAMSLTSCDTATGTGAAAGAAGGALIGGLASNRVGGAVVGAGLGALTGALIGNAVDQENARSYGPEPRGGYPVGRRTDSRGVVLSPYGPYHEIDVAGIPHGALVRDPSCNRLFVNP